MSLCPRSQQALCQFIDNAMIFAVLNGVFDGVEKPSPVVTKSKSFLDRAWRARCIMVSKKLPLQVYQHLLTSHNKRFSQHR